MRKVIIVTGGSKGIGNAIVKYLANDNNIILNYNKSEELAIKTKKELHEKGIEIDIFKADVSKREEVRKLVEFAANKYKKIDVLVNNAGIDKWQLFTDIRDEDWQNIMDINLKSAFMMSQEVVKNMLEYKSGCIINISSIWGITGASCEVAYSVSKAGMNGLTKALAKELALSNIRVNAIAPGMINTDMNRGFSKEELNEIADEIPMQKIGEPIDIAKCVKWMIEDEYTTGQIISINGGWNI